MLKLLTLFIFLIIHGYHLAQIQVVDSLSSEPVPFTHIRAVKNNKYVISNHDGYFFLDSLRFNNDSLIISSIGFATKKIAVKNLHSSSKIPLIPKQQQLEEVAVVQKKGKYKLKKLGVTKKPRKLFPQYGITSQNGTIQAVHIPNIYSAPGVLKYVNVYITDNGYPDGYFRIHVYDVSLIEIKPDKELTSSNIVKSGTKGNEWVKFDLIEERITIGENGCFIGIEWFENTDSKRYQDTLIYKTTVINGDYQNDTLVTEVKSGDGVVLGARYELYQNAKNKIWYKLPFDAEWLKWGVFMAKYQHELHDSLIPYFLQQVDSTDHSFLVPCINITASFSKGKAELNYIEPQNQKLDQFESIDEDISMYPQSSVVELFNSLIAAFENDDIIYAMKYLCVYRNDELESMINSLEDNHIRTGNYFSETDKNQIIKHFNEILENMSVDSITKIDAQHFELKVNNNSSNLFIVEGKWKLQPVTFK
ncbi:carboxypeptidase-like regulatory domain-containing protein [Brumimicrobium mesophilum]|uniref:carboxypeptidase-like regulatory domain-containing protein n=1 Tax=Brumimicrobium mesophilum TaxID=392717 RepID=UPI000D144839|nr:carboxypeptidase-like regulatory domain-containing protein [Brumimicrobium mesophilum]